MNTANLQLKGILLALYALLNAMKEKGALSEQEIDAALREAEAKASLEGVERSELSKSNAEAMLFPIRFLREANGAASPSETFSTITQLVAEKE